MNERKIVSLLQSEEFLAKLNDAETLAETKKIFASEGLELNDEKAQTIMGALESATKKAHNGEMMSEEDLKYVSGGSFIKKSLELIILSALFVEGTRVAFKVHKRGGLNPKLQQTMKKGKNILSNYEDRVADWLAGSR